MSEKLSVKGMTFGTEEYVKTAKRAEQIGEVDEIISRIDKEVDRIVGMGVGITYSQRWKLRYIREDIDYLTGDYGEASE